jgi:hypothetical protein
MRWLAMLMIAIATCVVTAQAATPEEMLAAYADQARKADAGFAGFSAARGRELYFRQFRMPDGEMLSCASCHTEDPRRERFAHQDPIPCRACHRFQSENFDEIPKVRRQMLPLAPSANPDRFTRPAVTEQWFGFNCTLLMKRDCTVLEKGDVLTWLMTVR